jgi:hypothetical protein
VAVEVARAGPLLLRGDGLLFRLAHRRLGGRGLRLLFRRQFRLDGRRLWHLCPGLRSWCSAPERAPVNSSSPFGVPKPASVITPAAGRLAESAWAWLDSYGWPSGACQTSVCSGSLLGRATQLLWRGVSWRPQASSPNHSGSPTGRSRGGMGA